MSPTVKTINEQAIKTDLKSSGKKEALHYIKKLKEAIERQQRLTGEAINKLRQVSESEARLKEDNEYLSEQNKILQDSHNQVTEDNERLKRENLEYRLKTAKATKQGVQAMTAHLLIRKDILKALNATDPEKEEEIATGLTHFKNLERDIAEIESELKSLSAHDTDVVTKTDVVDINKQDKK